MKFSKFLFFNYFNIIYRIIPNNYIIKILFFMIKYLLSKQKITLTSHISSIHTKPTKPTKPTVYFITSDKNNILS